MIALSICCAWLGAGVEMATWRWQRPMTIHQLHLSICGNRWLLRRWLLRAVRDHWRDWGPDFADGRSELSFIAGHATAEAGRRRGAHCEIDLWRRGRGGTNALERSISLRLRHGEFRCQTRRAILCSTQRRFELFDSAVQDSNALQKRLVVAIELRLIANTERH